MGNGVVQIVVTGEPVSVNKLLTWFSLGYLIFCRKHVDFLHYLDSFPTTLPILFQPLSFGHKYSEKLKVFVQTKGLILPL